VPGISFPDVLKSLERTGAVQSSQRERFLLNYQFFEQNRDFILKKYPHSWWVAAVDQKLYAQSALKKLEIEIDALPLQAGNYAYIEQIL
jgi:hypothetical protein